MQKNIPALLPGLEISIRNRKSIFSTFLSSNAKILYFFFHYRLGLFPTFLRGTSILINQYFFLNKFSQKFILLVIVSTLSGCCGVCR